MFSVSFKRQVLCVCMGGGVKYISMSVHVCQGGCASVLVGAGCLLRGGPVKKVTCFSVLMPPGLQSG